MAQYYQEYLGGGGKKQQKIFGSSLEDIQKQAVKLGINPVNLQKPFEFQDNKWVESVPNLEGALKGGTEWKPPEGYEHIPDIASQSKYTDNIPRPGTEEIWGKPITPVAKISPITGQPEPPKPTAEELGMVPDIAQPKTDWTMEEIKREYKEGLGIDYEPVAGQDWGSVLEHHAEKGTSPQELREWMAKPEVQAQVEKEKTLRTQLEEIKTQDDKGLEKTLIEAGFNAEDMSNIIATFTDQMPKWSEKTAEIEAQWKAKKDEAEKKIAEIEDKLITFFETNESIVKTFESYSKDYELDSIRADVTAKDEEINKANAQLNAELLDASGKVVPQWMITGEKKLSVQRATNTLNRLASERNTAAEKYNRAWDEIVVKIGLREKDVANEALNLKSQLDIYSGREAQVNQKIIEALTKGGIEFEEDKQEILNNIKAGLAYSMADVARELLEAKALGESKFINMGKELGLYYFDATTGELKQAIEGLGAEKKIKLSQTQLNKLATKGVSEDQAIEFQKYLEMGIPIEDIRKRAEEQGTGNKFDAYLDIMGGAKSIQEELAELLKEK